MRVVIPTQKTSEQYKDTNHYKCLEKLQEDYTWCYGECESFNKFEIDIIENNIIGLSKLYNSVLDNNPNEDIIVFLHDDVEIHDLFFVEKLKKAHEQYEIVGLAGATTQHYSKDKPSVWHLCVQDSDSTKGFVSHRIPKGFNGVKESHINSSYFGPTPNKVVVIDGLFMSIDVKKIKDKLKNYSLFDNDFNWHHYDCAACLNAFRFDISMGVWPIFVIHEGLGEFQNNEWKQSHEKFIKKYNGWSTMLDWTKF